MYIILGRVKKKKVLLISGTFVRQISMYTPRSLPHLEITGLDALGSCRCSRDLDMSSVCEVRPNTFCGSHVHGDMELGPCQERGEQRNQLGRKRPIGDTRGPLA